MTLTFLESTLVHHLFRRRGFPSLDDLLFLLQQHAGDVPTVRWLDNTISSSLASTKPTLPYQNDCLFERLIGLYARQHRNPLWPRLWNELCVSSPRWSTSEWTVFFQSIIGSGMDPVFRHIPNENVLPFLSRVSLEDFKTVVRATPEFGPGVCQAPYPELLKMALSAGVLPANLFVDSPWLLPHVSFDNLGSEPPIAPLLCAVMEPQCVRFLFEHGADPFLRATRTGLTAIASLFHQDSFFFEPGQRAATLNAAFCATFPCDVLTQSPDAHPDLFLRFFECVAHSRQTQDLTLFSSVSPLWFHALLEDDVKMLQMAVVNPLALSRLLPHLDPNFRYQLLSQEFTGQIAHTSSSESIPDSEMLSPNSMPAPPPVLSFSLYDCLLASGGGTLWHGQDAAIWKRLFIKTMAARAKTSPPPLFTEIGVKRYVETTLFLRNWLVAGAEEKIDHTPPSEGRCALFNPRPLFGFAQSAHCADRPEDLYLRLTTLFKHYLPSHTSLHDFEAIDSCELYAHLFMKHMKTFVSQLSELQHRQILVGLVHSFEQAPLHSPFSSSLYYEDGIFGARVHGRIRPSTPEAASFSVLIEGVKRVCLLAQDVQSRKPNQSSYQNVCDALCTPTTREAHFSWFKRQFDSNTLTLADLQRALSNPHLSYALCSESMFEHLSDKQHLLEQTFYDLSRFSEHAALTHIASAPPATKAHRTAL
jgi:hypothetical protein